MTDELFTLPPQSQRSKDLAWQRKLAKGGYAARPGSGPEGETCKTCEHIARKEMGKTYLKCGLMQAQWTGGPGTDIRASAPACSKWLAKEKK